MIFFLPQTFGGCRKRFFSFRKLSAVAGNGFFPSANFRRLPKTIFFLLERFQWHWTGVFSLPQAVKC
jgi:hypothetical protein